jgi:hypothetical protein
VVNGGAQKKFETDSNKTNEKMKTTTIKCVGGHGTVYTYNGMLSIPET